MNEKLYSLFVKSLDSYKLNGTKLKFGELDFSRDSHAIVEVFGGENGAGSWVNYFEQLKILTEVFEEQFERVILIDLFNDCLDDVFYARFSLR